jgi:hypothetical protein
MTRPGSLGRAVRMSAPSIDFAQLSRVARQVIQESDLSKRKRALLHAIVLWSFERDREWAVFEKLDDLVALTGVHRPDVTNALSELQAAGLLLRKQSRGELRLRFLPHGALAPAPLRVDGGAASKVREKLEQLNPPGPNWPQIEPSGQGRLPLPPSSEEAVMNELAAESQAAAVSESLTKPRAGVSKSLTQSVSESLTDRVPRVRARPACHVPLPTAKHVHDHVHAPDGELKPEEEDLLEQVEELTASEGKTEHFHTTWLMRIRDKPLAVFQAIGETRMAKNEGRIRRTIGGTLNWHFKYFREGARKARQTLASLLFY